MRLRQVGRDVAALALDAVALDALLGLEQLLAAARVARNDVGRERAPGGQGARSITEP